MNDMTLPSSMDDTTTEDAAWASIETPLSVEALTEFCKDIERLYRINPMLEFKYWKALDKDTFTTSGRNISQETPFNFEFELKVTRRPDGCLVEYSNGIKSSTEFKIESSQYGSKLTITDRYERLPVEERESHMGEVDKSLVTWANYLQRFIVMWQRWSKFKFWRWYMRRVWQPMKPTARRITYMLLWISLVEVALILLGVGIYFSEYA
jgi:hypothetical protein